MIKQIKYLVVIESPKTGLITVFEIIIYKLFIIQCVVVENQAKSITRNL